MGRAAQPSMKTGAAREFSSESGASTFPAHTSSEKSDYSTLKSFFSARERKSPQTAVFFALDDSVSL